MLFVRPKTVKLFTDIFWAIVSRSYIICKRLRAYEHVTGEMIYPPSLAHWSWRVCFYHKTKTNGPNKILFQFEEEKIISFHMSKFQLIMTNSLRFISQENTPTFKKQRWWITRFSSDMLKCLWSSLYTVILHNYIYIYNNAIF